MSASASTSSPTSKRPRDDPEDFATPEPKRVSMLRQFTPNPADTDDDAASDSDADSDAGSGIEDPPPSLSEVAVSHIVRLALVPETKHTLEWYVQNGYRPESPGPGRAPFWPAPVLKDMRCLHPNRWELRQVVRAQNWIWGENVVLKAGDCVAVCKYGKLQFALIVNADGTVKMEKASLTTLPTCVLEQGIGCLRSSLIVRNGLPYTDCLKVFEPHPCDCVKQEKMEEGDECTSDYCHNFQL